MLRDPAAPPSGPNGPPPSTALLLSTRLAAHLTHSWEFTLARTLGIWSRSRVTRIAAVILQALCDLMSQRAGHTRLRWTDFLGREATLSSAGLWTKRATFFL